MQSRLRHIGLNCKLIICKTPSLVLNNFMIYVLCLCTLKECRFRFMYPSETVSVKSCKPALQTLSAHLLLPVLLNGRTVNQSPRRTSATETARPTTASTLVIVYIFTVHMMKHCSYLMAGDKILLNSSLFLNIAIKLYILLLLLLQPSFQQYC